MRFWFDLMIMLNLYASGLNTETDASYRKIESNLAQRTLTEIYLKLFNAKLLVHRNRSLAHTQRKLILSAEQTSVQIAANVGYRSKRSMRLFQFTRSDLRQSLMLFSKKRNQLPQFLHLLCSQPMPIIRMRRTVRSTTASAMHPTDAPVSNGRIFA
ncbi:hypothetical protein [Sulfitobacter sp.]|uniref:hypothetical protein n=1 Tax=Sulfitobacter sp. TaxID=1903071 RepID=UPI00300370EC